jgi:hypothetical protein
MLDYFASFTSKFAFVSLHAPPLAVDLLFDYLVLLYLSKTHLAEYGQI